MPGSATSMRISSSETALPTSALSPHCLSLEWVFAEHSHQVGCQDTQTTGIAIPIVLYETAKGASPGKMHHANAYPCTSLELQRSETYSLSLPWGQVLKILGSHITLVNLKHLHNRAGKGCLWAFKNCWRIWLTLHSWQRGAV